jgi:hypothetical protein
MDFPLVNGQAYLDLTVRHLHDDLASLVFGLFVISLLLAIATVAVTKELRRIADALEEQASQMEEEDE